MATENSENTPNSVFKKEITWGQLAGFIIGFVTLLGANWWTMAITTARNDARITSLEENTSSMAKLFKETSEKQDSRNEAKFQRIDDKLEVIVIKLENKKEK